MADIASITAVTAASAQPVAAGSPAVLDSIFASLLQDTASAPQPAASPLASIMALLQSKMLPADANAASNPSLPDVTAAAAIEPPEQAKAQPDVSAASAAPQDAVQACEQQASGQPASVEESGELADQIGDQTQTPSEPGVQTTPRVTLLETDDATPVPEMPDETAAPKPAASPTPSAPDALAAFVLAQIGAAQTQSAPAPAANDAASVTDAMTANAQPAPAKDQPQQDQSSAETKQQAAMQAEKAAAPPSNAADRTADSRNSDPSANTPAPQSNAQPAAPAAHNGQSSIVPPVGVAATTPADVRAGKIAAQIQVAPQQPHDIVTTPDRLGLAIAAKSVDGVRHFDIRLDPPELGRVQVHLSVDDSGRAQASLVVDKPQTLELLQRDSSSLNRALTDAGLDLSNNGLNFSLREQYRQNDDGGVDKGRGRSLSVKAVVQTDASPIQSSLSYAPDSVRLDIRV